MARRPPKIHPTPTTVPGLGRLATQIWSIPNADFAFKESYK